MWVTRNLEIKIGRFHPTFTLYGPALVDALESPYYPLMNQRMGPGRQIGIEFDRRSRFVQLYLGAFNGSDQPGAWRDTTSSKDVLVRTDVTLLDWMRLVMEGMYGKATLSDSLDSEHLLTGLGLWMDWELTVHIRAEWLRRWHEIPNDADADQTREQISEGVLLHLGYSFTPALEALIRYEWYDGDLDREASWGIDDAWTERVTLGIQYQIVPGHLSLNGYYLHYSGESNPTLQDNSHQVLLGDQAILECQLAF